jgi:hypothetical protein
MAESNGSRMEMGTGMTLREWSNSSIEYGRKLVDSGVQGARSGERAFLDGRRLTPYLNRSARIALGPAAVGACLGVLGSNPRARRTSSTRAFLCAALGCVVGFGAGIAWKSRGLAASVASGAIRNIGRVRDEHWLERHPIDYA